MPVIGFGESEEIFEASNAREGIHLGKFVQIELMVEAARRYRDNLPHLDYLIAALAL